MAGLHTGPFAPPHMLRYTSDGFINHPMHVELSAHAIFLIGQGTCVKKLSGKAKLEDSRATKPIVALLSAPLEKYSNIVTALELSNYPRVMDYLDNATTKAMAVVIIQSIMKNTTCISTSDKVKVSC
jgi:hypothetical protein